MQRVFRVVNTADLRPVGVKTTTRFNRSVRRYGVVTPIFLADVPDQDGVIGLTIIDGNRRVRAARAERLPKVPAVVLKATSAQDRARLTLICNHMRSSNFHTESAAITLLADDDDAAQQAAGMMGLGPGRMLTLYRKITTMPDAVRQAMYEHRIPVTAATWVGSWPEELQQEVVELLERRRYLNTPTLKAIRTSFEERHPEAFQSTRAIDDAPAIDDWIDEEPVVIEAPIEAPSAEHTPEPFSLREEPVSAPHPPLSAGVPVADTTMPVAPVTPPLVASSQPSVDAPVTEPVTSSGEPLGVVDRVVVASSPPDQSAESEWQHHTTSPVTHMPSVERPGDAVRSSMHAIPPEIVQATPGPSNGPFLARLDAGLLNLARETQANDLSRAVWVDRAMRAWSLAEAAGGARASASVGD